VESEKYSQLNPYLCTVEFEKKRIMVTKETANKKTGGREKADKPSAAEEKTKSSRAEMFGYFKGKITFAEGDIFNLGL
jgi:hypothetical protein